MMSKFFDYEKKLQFAKAERRHAAYVTDVLKMEVKHHKQHGFTIPIDADTEIEKAQNAILDFDQILKDQPKRLKERFERKAMIVGYIDIFDELCAKMSDCIDEMHESFDRQYRAQ